MGGPLGSAWGWVLLLHQAGPCMASGEQLSQLIVAQGCSGEEHKVVSLRCRVPSALSLLAERDSSEFLLTCQSPGSASSASM